MIMKIKIIQFGKTKSAHLDAEISKYLKRLKPYAKIEIVTLSEITPSKTYTAKKCLEEEGRSLIKNLKENDFVIALDERGREFRSSDFATYIKTPLNLGQTVVFIIGSAFGLSDTVKSHANQILSLSQMTFTHEMIRLFLIEQIYRSICILRGKEYHIA